MGGGSLEVAEAIDDHVGGGWVSLPLGALPVEAMLAKGLAAAKRSVDDILRDGLKPGLTRPVFYPVGGGWRSLAKAHIQSVGAPVKGRSRLHARRAGSARIRAVRFAPDPGQARRDSGRRCAAGAHLAGCGAGAGSRAQASRTGARRVFGPRAARGPALFATHHGGAILSIR